MTIQPEIQRIAQLIDTEATLLQGFVALLEREENLLIAGDADALLTLSQEKTERYHQLQRIHADRELMLTRLRKPHTDTAIREVCAQLPTTLARWTQVLELAAEAQRHNALNGKLITERMQHNQAALSILLNATQRPQLYDAAGMTRTTGTGRHLGSA